MKKRYILTVAVVCLLALSGCGHSHQWQEADCDTAKTCLECGRTEGEALGHSWAEATCTEPKTCTACGAKEGSAVGHEWKEATCQEPMTCLACGIQEGEVGLCNWVSNTCDAPYICTCCGLTSGDPIEHIWWEATCVSPVHCELCGVTEGTELGDHKWNEANCTSPKKCMFCGMTDGDELGDHRFSMATTEKRSTCHFCGLQVGELFNPDPRFSTPASKCVWGLYRTKVNIPINKLQEENMRSILPDSFRGQQYLECWIYLDIYVNAKMNMLITPVLGKKIEIAYAPDVLELDMGVYYVEDGVLYIANDWDQEMTPLTIIERVENETLVLDGNILGPTTDDRYRKLFHSYGDNQFWSCLDPDTDLGVLTFEQYFE